MVSTVPANGSSVTVSRVELTNLSLVLTTIQQNRHGIFVQAAVPDIATNSFTIFLNQAVSQKTQVAWFVVN